MGGRQQASAHTCLDLCAYSACSFAKVVNEDDWQQGSAQEEEQTQVPRISRRSWGSGRLTRPRPLSDYGQLVSRSLSIPEDAIAVDPPDDDHVDKMHPSRVTTTSQDPRAPSGCSRGGRRRRPISVIGGVSFYGNTQAEDVENLLVQVRAGVSTMASRDPWLLASVLPAD